MGNTSDPNEMKESRYADVVSAKLTQQIDPALSIAKVVSVDARARAWRVTLAPIKRDDGKAINPGAGSGDAGGSTLLFDSSTRQYAAGQEAHPTVPPRRANPIFGASAPSNGADINPLFVQLVWGMSAGKQCTLIADWPMQGGSIVVEGSYVEVFGALRFGVGEGRPVVQGDLPVFAAHITPADGLASEAQGELSVSQSRPLAATVSAGLVAGFYTDGIAVPTMGFQVGAAQDTGAPPRGAMVGSTVYNVAPFSSWAGVLRFGPGAANTTTKLVIFTSNVGGPIFTISDNAQPDGGGGFGFEFGTVGINYITDGATGVKTIADLEALIATSALVQIAQPDTVNAAKKLFAGFTKLNTHVPNAPGPLFGTSLTVGATQGCAVYVPDFARRVRVEAAQLNTVFLGNEYRVPSAGPLPLNLVWYDDQGRVVYTEFQGRTQNEDSSITGTTEPNVWRPVPAQAVMLAVYCSLVSDATAFFHWRLTP